MEPDNASRISEMLLEAVEALKTHLTSAGTSTGSGANAVACSRPPTTTSTTRTRPTTSSPSTPVTASSSSQFRHTELRRLFSPYGAAAASKTSKKKPKTVRYMTKAFALIEPYRKVKFSNEEKAEAIRAGHVKNITIDQNMSEESIKALIRLKFSLDLNFHVMMNCGKELIQVPFDGEELDGQYFQSTFYHKTLVYIRPTLEEEETECITIECEDDMGVDLVAQDKDLEIRHYDEAVVKQPVTFEQVLAEIQAKVNKEDLFPLNISRNSVLECLSRSFERQSFDAFKTMDVKFVNEAGVDCGALTKELWRIALEALRNSNIFEGDAFSKNVSYNLKDFEEKKYFEAGRIMALALIHSGPGPQFLSEFLVECFLNGIPDEFIHASLDDVTCSQLKNELKGIMESQRASEVATIIESSQFLQSCNVSPLFTNVTEKDMIVNGAIKRFLVHLKRDAMQQFFRGLDSFGIGTLLRKYRDDARNILSYPLAGDQKPLTAQKMNELFIINLSPEGKHNRVLEEQLVLYWKDYLLDCEEQKSVMKLETILKFVTGADKVPPLGFAIPPTIEFDKEPLGRLPTANACAATLYLPLMDCSFIEFKNNMDDGILGNGDLFLQP